MSCCRHVLALALVPFVASCVGESGGQNGDPAGSICQAGVDCCKKEELVCVGNPDDTTVCRCFKAWDCETAVDPQKCWQNPADVPDGKGGWTCQTLGATEKCIRPGSDVPAGKNGWSCKVAGSGVECSRPTNTPDGSSDWSCTQNGEFKNCVKGSTPQPDMGLPPPPTDHGVNPPPDGDLGIPPGWACAKNSLGEMVCKNPDGMPSGGGTWKCYWKNNVITCEGSSPTPPGGGGWTCVQNEFVGGWRCTKPIQPGDTPGGSGTWNCYSGTPFSGTVCVQPPPKTPGSECIPGTMKWCDGNTYCGWGQTTCGPDGKWKTKLDPQSGQMVLDCWELPDGRRPNTKCACYFYYWNKDCCENPDCIVPPGTNGQICPLSAGNYCDYCHPLNPECKGVGAKCIVTTNNETYCGQDCAGGKPCPGGSSCQKLSVDSQYFWLCVPNDLSCYY